MFRTNDKHSQQSLFESTCWMDPKIREKLEKSWAPIFYEHVFRKIAEEPFAVLYSDAGAPNFPVNILLSLEYIKHMKDVNDLDLLDSYYFDYLVNYAVGNRVLGERNLAERTLYYFRERIYQYCLENPGKDDLLFGQFIKSLKDFAKEAGLAFDEQRTDTTFFMSNIKKAGRMSLAYDVLVKAVRAIPESLRTDALSGVLEPKFRTDTLYRAKSQEADSRLAALLGLCQDALLILEGLPDMPESEEVRIVRRFLNEQSVNAPDGKPVPKPNKEISSGSLQSAHDEGATYRRKQNVGYSGYTLQISETCGEENPFQLITDYAARPNNISDVEILEGRLGVIRENTGCSDMYVDGGFHSPDIHETAKENGINIHLTNMSGTAPAKKLPVTEFDMDAATNIISRCPAGHTPVRAWLNSAQTCASFPRDVCDGCALREQCHSKQQVKNCVVTINIKAVNAGRERAKMEADKAANTSKRAAIEGTNSALKRKGLDKLEVRGEAKTKVVSGLKVMAQNIGRFIRYKQGKYKPNNANTPKNGIPVPIFTQ